MAVTHPYFEHEDGMVVARDKPRPTPDKTVRVYYKGQTHDATRFSGKGSFGRNVARAYQLLKDEQTTQTAVALRAAPVAAMAAQLKRVFG